MRLTDLLRGAPPARRRRPRTSRADAPRTIVPLVDDARNAAPEPAGSPFDLRVDAARERLRRAIPPLQDEE
ncbi:MAG TPA: hypothetical protein VFT50_09910 [Baekduia sp.]|nr:hypothetical protein [Baekduia sp.]